MRTAEQSTSLYTYVPIRLAEVKPSDSGPRLVLSPWVLGLAPSLGPWRPSSWASVVLRGSPRTPSAALRNDQRAEDQAPGKGLRTKDDQGPRTKAQGPSDLRFLTRPLPLATVWRFNDLSPHRLWSTCRAECMLSLHLYRAVDGQVRGFAVLPSGFRS